MLNVMTNCILPPDLKSAKTVADLINDEDSISLILISSEIAHRPDSVDGG